MSEPETPTQPWGMRARLPVLAAAGHAYAVLWTHRDDLLRLAIIPALLSFGLSLLLTWQFGLPAVMDPRDPPNVSPWPWVVPISFLGMIPITLFGANWLRVLLGGSDSVRGLGLHWGWRETRFLLRWLAIAAAAMLATIPGIILLMVTVIVMVAAGGVSIAPLEAGTIPPTLRLTYMALVSPLLIIEAYVALRLALALPATALDQPGGIRLSWKLTRGSGFRLIGVVLLVAAPFYITVLALQFLLGATGAYAMVPFSVTLVAVLVGYPATAAGYAALASAYRRLGGPKPTAT